MTSLQQLALYSTLVVVAAVGGALVPLLTLHRRLIAFLSFAAGLMLGATFFHMLPGAVHLGGYPAIFWVPAGFVLFFLLERYVLVHVCEEPPDCAEHGHGHALGLTAFLGLSVHTLLDGLALGAAAQGGVGLSAFMAIVAHKVPSSLSLAAILRAEGRSPTRVVAYAVAYGLMVPIGAALYFVLAAAVPLEAFSPGALAFSAGTFLYIAVSDLLPHINRHGRGGSAQNIAGLLLGLAATLALTFVAPHDG